MTDYTKLVKALRLIGKEQDCNECEAGRWHHDFECCLFEDAAAAIEALEHELNVQKNMLENLLMSSKESLLPKRGDWIWQDAPLFGNPYGSYKCKSCGCSMPHKTNYCPNCGAKMEVQDGANSGF